MPDFLFCFDHFHSHKGVVGDVLPLRCTIKLVTSFSIRGRQFKSLMTNKIQTQTGFVSVPGGQLYYESVGDGPVLVLIHAGIADSRMWDSQMEAFAKHYRVIRYDVRGFGQSKSENVTFSARQDLRDLLTALGVERAHLMGVSLGGLIITDYALEFPAMVRSLIPVGAGPGGFDVKAYVTERELPRFKEMDEAFAKKDVARVREVVVQIWVDGFHRTPDQVDPVVREKVGTMMIDNFKQHQSEQITDKPLTPPAVGRLAEIKAPTLVIVGAVDVSPILAGVDKLAAGIPGARKVVIENTAHVPNMEQPAEFNRLVLDFLSSVERG